MTTLIQRINVLLRTSVNHLLDQAEDPDRALAQIIRDTNEHVAEARHTVIAAVASEKALRREMESARSQAARWAERAEKALRAGDENLAREALARKVEHRKNAESIEPAWSDARRTVEQLKRQLKALEARRGEAVRRRAGLVARQHAARARHSLHTRMARVPGPEDTLDRFDELERRVTSMECEAEAVAEVMGEQDRLERSVDETHRARRVDAELEALRRELENTDTGAGPS